MKLCTEFQGKRTSCSGTGARGTWQPMIFTCFASSSPSKFSRHSSFNLARSMCPFYWCYIFSFVISFFCNNLLWRTLPANSLVFVSTFQFFVSTFQFFVNTFQFFVSTSQFYVTRFKKKLFTHLKKKCSRQLFFVCAVIQKNVSTVFCVCIIVIFYVIFNILRKRVKDHTCLYYAIVICNCYIIVS